MQEMIQHNKPTLGKEEREAANRVISSGWVAQGKEVESFENELCDYLGLPEGHAVMVSSGTAALYLAVLQTYKESFAYPVYACSSIRNAIAMAGRECIELDVSRNSPNVDISDIRQKDYDVAIIPHIFGIPADVHKAQVIFIEDAAQALGAKINNQPVGTFGRYGVFSFSATKLITSGGQGGAVVSSDPYLIDEIRNFREFDMRRDYRRRFNFQMTDIQAAIGRVQLKKLDSFIERREEIFQKYLQAGFKLIQSKGKIKKDVRYRAVIETGNPDYLINGLAEYGIKAIVPIEEFEILGGQKFFPNALKLTHNTVSLPIYPSLTDQEVDLIILTVQRCLE